MLFIAINNTIFFQRELNLKLYRGSAFLFGPRMTGKTALLEKVPAAKYYDLLDPDLEMRFKGSAKYVFRRA